MPRRISLITGAECTENQVSELSRLEFAAERVFWTNGVALYIRGINPHLSMDELFYVKGFQLESVGMQARIIDPSVKLLPGEAQQLMDELWKCGVRPTDDNMPSPAAYKALSEHLADMRRIAFKYLFKEG